MPAKPNPRRTSAKTPAAKATAATPRAEPPAGRLIDLGNAEDLNNPAFRAAGILNACTALRAYPDYARKLWAAQDEVRRWANQTDLGYLATPAMADVRGWEDACRDASNLLRKLARTIPRSLPDRPRRYLVEGQLVALHADKSTNWAVFIDELNQAAADARRELEHLRLRAGEVTADAHGPTPTKPGQTYLAGAVAEMAGVSDTTLNRYAKLAGVPTPQRGKRNHRYSADEVRAILQAMIGKTSDRKMKGRCRQALGSLDGAATPK
jgi:hypothetical protein